MIFSEFTLIVEALKEHQVIKKVIMPYSFKSLSSFISDCETVCTEQFPISIDFGHHFTDVKKGVFCFSPKLLYSHKIIIVEISSLQSFADRFAIHQLTLKNCRFTDESTIALCDFIKFNNDLTLKDFSFCQLDEKSISKIINVIWSSSYLKTVDLSHIGIGFKFLLNLFERYSTHKSPPKIEIFAHHLDFEHGVICFSPERSTQITAEEISRLQSFVKTIV
ncbi:hypothetical protein GEMRC1_009873 [Eukaryota sp. GEM-RC1]